MSDRTSNEVRSGGKLLPSLGILLVTGGLVLLGWFAYIWFNPGPAPYQYQHVETGSSTELTDVELDAWPDLTLSRYNVDVAGVDKPIGQVTLAKRGNEPPVLVHWKNYTNDLLIAIDQKPSELSTLAKAIAKHAPEDSLILSWWDTSRQLKLLSQRDTMFTNHMVEPLIIPDAWQPKKDAIYAYEEEFWQSVSNDKEHKQFQKFTEALLATPDEGIAKLRELIGSDREAYLVVHVTDLFKLGLMHPDKFGIAYKSFPLTGNMHGLINHVKVHKSQNGYVSYTLQSLSEKKIRGYFLADESSIETLMAKTLPFTDQTAPVEMEIASLIYQHGGYWVYKIPAATVSKDATKG